MVVHDRTRLTELVTLKAAPQMRSGFFCVFEGRNGSAAERAEGKEKEDKNCFAMVDKYRASSYNRTIQ